ncbi:MAG: hypothetical protein FJ308_13805 [Planctomycetes bacterium]|nr:hypothetical protein [Planctomycetota bacterium]
MDAEEETSVTELEIMPDGRIFVFGASGQVLEILSLLQSPTDPTVASRLCGESHSLLDAISRSHPKPPTDPEKRDCNSDILG